MRSLRVENVHTAGTELRSLPRGKYFGFAIGADGVHQELLVELEGVAYYVGLGSPAMLPAGGIEGVPTIKPIRKLVYQVNLTYGVTTELDQWRSPAQLVAMECPRELGLAVPTRLRSIVTNISFSGTATAAKVLVIPFAGRLSCLLSLDGVSDDIQVLGGSYDITGGTPIDQTQSTAFVAPDSTYELTAKTNAAGVLDIVTQDVGAYDVLVLTLGDGTAFAPAVGVRVI